MLNLSISDEFYYADRRQGKPIKCKVLDIGYGFPTKIVARNIETEQVIVCYEGFGCYTLNEYNQALKDAQTKLERIVY